MQYLAVLGRQVSISLAELSAQFSDVKLIAPGVAEFSCDSKPEINRLGGTIKLAQPITGSVSEFLQNLPGSSKAILGVSDYSRRGASAKKSQTLALGFKKDLKRLGRSARVLPNKTATLSSAAVLHNGLGQKPGCVELILVDGRWYAGIGIQDIEAYARRDQARPARDAKVGMLPPKLAQILINLAGPLPAGARILDPFCGTGVVLQEALLMGYTAYGTDKEERMVGLAEKNLEWLSSLAKTYSFDAPTSAKSKGLKTVDFSLGLREIASNEHVSATSVTSNFVVFVGDATSFVWEHPIDAVVFEGYLGPPMSQAPADIKMKSVISDLLPLYYHTLRNLSSQIKVGTPVVMAIPAWLRPNGSYRKLFDFKQAETLDEVEQLGYNVVKYQSLGADDLLYYREGQVVAREIIVLRKK